MQHKGLFTYDNTNFPFFFFFIGGAPKELDP